MLLDSDLKLCPCPSGSVTCTASQPLPPLAVRPSAGKPTRRPCSVRGPHQDAGGATPAKNMSQSWLATFSSAPLRGLNHD